MKKDGIQTRNRKLAAKAKKKRMHDFFKPLDPRFSAYATGMHGSAGSYLTNPMSQYYAGQMGQMSSFMSNTMPAAMSMGSPMSHLTGLASLPTSAGDPSGGGLTATAAEQQQLHHHAQQLHQQHLNHQHSAAQGAPNFTNGNAGDENPTSLVGASA